MCTWGAETQIIIYSKAEDENALIKIQNEF